MIKRVLGLVLVTVVFAALPAFANGGSKCMIYGPPYAMATPAASVYVGVTFQTGGGNPTAGMCSPATVMTAGGLNCLTLLTPVGNYNCPATAAAPGCRGILAKLPLTKIPGTFMCTFMCDCGFGYGSETFVIDNADGLPVELMNFSIEREGEPANEAATEDENDDD